MTEIMKSKNFSRTPQQFFVRQVESGLSKQLLNNFQVENSCVCKQLEDDEVSYKKNAYQKKKKINKYVFINNMIHSSTKSFVRMVCGKSPDIWLINNFYAFFVFQKSLN